MADLRGPFHKPPSPSSAPSIVGAYLREKRETAGLSQRALGQLFDPHVTTQFISNIERGVTPLPPAHIQTLVRVLSIPESELITVLEREYAAKISIRVGRTDAPLVPGTEEDRAYFLALYEAFRKVDPTVKETFISVCETLLHVPKPSSIKVK